MVVRAPILLAARSGAIRRMVEAVPVTRDVVRRFVAGADVDAAVTATQGLADAGLAVSLDVLGEDTADAAQAAAATGAYLLLLGRLAEAGLTPAAEVSVKLSSLGLGIDPAMARDNAAAVCGAARDAGTTVTVDAEDHTTTDAALAAVVDLRRDFPGTGAVVQAYLRRTEADCRALAGPGSRVRLCKGAYAEPPAVAFTSRTEVDASYARCLAVLMAGRGRPMVATHDPALISLTGRLAARLRPGEAGAATYEFQMLFGVRAEEQRRLAATGRQVRVYVPFGPEWYGYLMRRLAERPANLTFFLRALLSRH